MRVSVLGGLVVEAGGREVAAPASRRAWEVLAWLAIHPGPQPRARLAATLWPDVLDGSARASLRSALWAMRGALGPDAARRHLVADRESVELRCETDIADFADRLRDGDLAGALALCRGPLLAGLEADWALDARDAHAERIDEALRGLAHAAPSRAQAIEWTRRRVAEDPLDESAVRDLIRHLAAAGRAGEALVAYDRFCDRLRRSLHVAPGRATRELAEAIRTPPPVPALSAGHPSRPLVVSCEVSGAVLEWRLTPAAVDGVPETRVDVRVKAAEESEAPRPAADRLAVAASLATLEALAPTGAPRGRG